MCEAGDMKMDKAQDLPGNVYGSVGIDIMTGQRPRDMSTPWWKEVAAWRPRGRCHAILSSGGEGPYQGRLLGGPRRVCFARWRREETSQKVRTA